MLAWFKVDDGFHSSRKVLSIPRRTRLAAIGAWALAGAWCADELTDGHVPDYMISEWGFPKSVVDALVDSGLWERERGGLAFRNWAEYQPSKADVDAERAASRDRMRELRAKRKQKKPQDDAEVGEVFGRTGANGSENVRNPDPTRPDPTHIEVAKATSTRTARGSRITSDWIPSPELIDQMRTECPGVNLEAEHRVFVDYWIAQPGQKGVKVDWEATWRNWMRRKQGDTKTRPAPSRADEAQSFIQRLEAIDATRGSGEATGNHQELR